MSSLLRITLVFGAVYWIDWNAACRPLLLAVLRAGCSMLLCLHCQGAYINVETYHADAFLIAHHCMQAWFLKTADSDLRFRWCKTHKGLEHPDSFRGYHHTCLGHLVPSLCATARLIEEEVRAQEVPLSAMMEIGDVGAGPSAAVASESDAEDDSDDDPCRAPFWKRQWGRQSVIVDGMTAREQLRGHLGDQGLAEWVHALTGVESDSSQAVDAAIRELLKALRGSTEVCAQGFGVSSPAPTVCASCGMATCPVGFAGQSVCLLCYASGSRGISLMDLQHAMVAGVLSDKGTAQPLSLSVVCVFRVLCVLSLVCDKMLYMYQ